MYIMLNLIKSSYTQQFSIILTKELLRVEYITDFGAKTTIIYEVSNYDNSTSTIGKRKKPCIIMI